MRTRREAPDARHFTDEDVLPAGADDRRDPALRRRLSPAALRTFFTVANAWQLSVREQRALLGGARTWRGGTASILAVAAVLSVSVKAWSSSGAAHLVAPKIRAHFARHLTEAQAKRDAPDVSLGAPPDESVIATLIDAAFWASLRREEGYVPRISLALVLHTGVGCVGLDEVALHRYDLDRRAARSGRKSRKPPDFAQPVGTDMRCASSVRDLTPSFA